MARTRRKFDEDFKAGAVRIVRETGKPIHRQLGVLRRARRAALATQVARLFAAPHGRYGSPGAARGRLAGSARQPHQGGRVEQDRGHAYHLATSYSTGPRSHLHPTRSHLMQ
jgi:hypothetical protein